MDRQTWTSISKIVDNALNLKAEKRWEYIQNSCRNDKQLKNQVTKFLKSIEESEAEKFLEEPSGLLDDLVNSPEFIKDSKPDTSRIGETIAHYKVLELIEQGGMGSVFLAERSDGAYQKKVALKLLKRSLSTPSNIARFRRERNILANLDHPNITHLLDGGITPDGLPFLVMDYVEGTPLLEHCSTHTCTIRERIQFFKSICKAVQHAHKNAVIHRDLKPSNILIANDGSVKVLDFGIAKMMEDELSLQSTSGPELNYNLFTLRYAAPEQITLETITTSTDIHGLGVLLYELLTGKHPFGTERKSVSEIKETIKNDRPKKPSQQITILEDYEGEKISAERSSTHKQLVQELSGDIDAIVCKALSKNPDERYSSVEAFLDDLIRTEKHQPVSAREHTPKYRSTKFFRRNNRKISAAAAFILIMTSFVIYHAYQINYEKEIAQQEARIADDVSGFLLELFDTDSNQDTLSVAGLLAKGMDHLESIKDEPTYANMLSVMGEAHMKFGKYSQAGELLQEAVDKSRSVHGYMSIEHASALSSMGMLHEHKFEWTEAVSSLQKSYSIYALLLGEGHSKTVNVLSHLAKGFRNTGDLVKAERYARKAVAHFNKNLDPDDPFLLSVSANLAYVLREREKFDEAELIYENVIENSENNPEVNSKTLARYYNDFGYLYRVQEKYTEATENYLRATHLKEQVYSEGHPVLTNTRKNLATSLYYQGRLREAGKLFKKNVAGVRKKYSSLHWRTASALNTLGVFHLENKQHRAAEPYLRESTQINREVLGSDHLWTAYTEGLLSACLTFQQKELGLADSLYHHHLKLFRENQDNFDINNKHQLDRLARINKVNGAPDSVYLAYRELLD